MIRQFPLNLLWLPSCFPLRQSTSALFFLLFLFFFLGQTLDACWELRPAPLSTQSQVHSGSFLLALYQPFMAPKMEVWPLCIDAHVCACVCVCRVLDNRGRSSFSSGAPSSSWGRRYIGRARLCQDVCISVLASMREQRDCIPNPTPPGSRVLEGWAVTSKGLGACSSSSGSSQSAKGGKPVYAAGARRGSVFARSCVCIGIGGNNLAELVANTAQAWHIEELPPPRQL